MDFGLRAKGEGYNFMRVRAFVIVIFVLGVWGEIIWKDSNEDIYGDTSILVHTLTGHNIIFNTRITFERKYDNVPQLVYGIATYQG